MYNIHVIMYIISGIEPISVQKKKVNTYRFTYFLHIFQYFTERVFANACSRVKRANAFFPFSTVSVRVRSPIYHFLPSYFSTTLSTIKNSYPQVKSYPVYNFIRPAAARICTMLLELAGVSCWRRRGVHNNIVP